MSNPQVDLVRQTLRLMARAAVPTAPITGYRDLRLRVAVTMPQRTWEGICELAADSCFQGVGRFNPSDVQLILAEHDHWAGLQPTEPGPIR